LQISSFNLNDKNSWMPLLNDDEISRSLDMPLSWMEKINISGEGAIIKKKGTF
jgi:hypothetical protein